MDTSQKKIRRIGIISRQISVRKLPFLLSICFSLVSIYDLSNALLSYALLSIVFFYACYLCIYETRRMSLPSLLNGNFIAIVTLGLIFLAAPIIRIMTNQPLPRIFDSRNWQADISNANFLACSAICALVASKVYLEPKTKPVEAKFSKLEFLEKRAKSISLVLALFFFLVFILWAQAQGPIVQVLFGTRALQGSIGVNKNFGYAVDSLFVVFAVVAFWFYVYLLKRHKASLNYLVMAVLLLVPSLFAGNRLFVFYYGGVLFLIYLGIARKVNWKLVLLLLPFVVFLSVVPREIRGSIDGLSLTSIQFSLNKDNLVKTFTGEDLAMAPALSILLESNIPRLYGTSYLEMVTKPIPRSWWESKPIPLDTQLMFQLFPSVRGSGFAFSSISEPYVNFGPAGVVVFFTLLGIFLRILLSSLYRRGGIYIFLNAWTAAFMFYLMRGNLSMDIQRYLFPLTISLIPYLLSRKVAGTISRY